MSDFENRKIDGYTYETRFIASWLNVGGKLSSCEDRGKFHDWLLALGLSSDEVHHIEFLTRNGKLELEVHAKAFLKGQELQRYILNKD